RRPRPSHRSLSAPPTTSPLSLHDALPIWRRAPRRPYASPPAARPPATRPQRHHAAARVAQTLARPPPHPTPRRPLGRHREPRQRSEEHTSELQSRENLVCRLLLEKKNIKS